MTHETFPNPKDFSFEYSNSWSAHYTSFHFGQKVRSHKASRGGSYSCKTPKNPLFGFLFVRKMILFWRRFVEAKFLTWDTHLTYAASAPPGDDAPGWQSTEMMSNVCFNLANTCRLPNMVKNDRQIKNERDSHQRHFLGHWLSFWGTLACKEGFFCMREDILSYVKDCCTMATRTGEKV